MSTENTGRELGWEDTIQNDGQDFEPIPAGDYDVTIERFDRSRSKGEGKLPACNMAVVYLLCMTVTVISQCGKIISCILRWNGNYQSCSVERGLKRKVKSCA